MTASPSFFTSFLDPMALDLNNPPPDEGETLPYLNEK